MRRCPHLTLRYVMVGTLRFSMLPLWLISGECIMDNDSSLSLDELNDRIAILEGNIRQLIEQAAAASGEQNESRIAERIDRQNEELDRLLKIRDARLNK